MNDIIRPRSLRTIGLALLVVSAVGSQGGHLIAAQSGQTALFGPVGVAPHEAVRVNVYGGGISDPDDVPWDFTVRVYNKRGQLAQEQRLQVAPGVTRSVDINIGNPDLFPAERAGRRTLRAEIVGFNPQPDPPGLFFATLEIYNRESGGTTVVIGSPDLLPATLR